MVVEYLVNIYKCLFIVELLILIARSYGKCDFEFPQDFRCVTSVEDLNSD